VENEVGKKVQDRGTSQQNDLDSKLLGTQVFLGTDEKWGKEFGKELVFARKEFEKRQDLN